MANLKNQNAGGKLKQSNVQKFARGGASMYDPYSYMTQGTCQCICEDGTEKTCPVGYGGCNCNAPCCPGTGRPKIEMGTGGRVNPTAKRKPKPTLFQRDRPTLFQRDRPSLLPRSGRR